DMTGDEFLGDGGKQKKQHVQDLQKDRGIPEEIMQLFKTIGREDKITIYDNIKILDDDQLNLVANLVKKTIQNQIDFDGFQIFIDVIKPIVRDKNFLHLLGKASYNLSLIHI
uniref:hypothetical protein n=1 Tax=Pedobacter sp. ASV12 TaxID=2795120 RepID=UPI001E3D6828